MKLPSLWASAVRTPTQWVEAHVSLLVRVALVPVFVGLCFTRDWQWLRNLTTEVLVVLSTWLRVPMYPVASDLVTFDNVQVRFGVSCTLIDAFAGAVPLLWRMSLHVTANLFRLAAVFAGFFVLNIVRLEGGFLAIDKGIPWWLGHDCVAGLTYFCVLVWIVRQKAWVESDDLS
jgi:hypothetical protein